jgi:hypothetical protein
MPEVWVAHPKFPIEFDEQMNEYQLLCEDSTAVMRYCFWCGGRLPESKRNGLFTTPSDDEMEEVWRLLSKAKTAEDVLDLLGSPDQEHRWDDMQTTDGVYEDAVRWTRTLRYMSRWESLVLDVQEMPDGRIQYAVFGQFADTPSNALPVEKHPWWKFWRKVGE